MTEPTRAGDELARVPSPRPAVPPHPVLMRLAATEPFRAALQRLSETLRGIDPLVLERALELYRAHQRGALRSRMHASYRARARRRTRSRR